MAVMAFEPFNRPPPSIGPDVWAEGPAAVRTVYARSAPTYGASDVELYLCIGTLRVSVSFDLPIDGAINVGLGTIVVVSVIVLLWQRRK